MVRLVRGVALIVGLYLNTHQSAHSKLHCSLVSPLPTSRTCCRCEVAVCGCVYCAGLATTAGQAPGQARPRCPAQLGVTPCSAFHYLQHTGHRTPACWTLRHGPLSHLCKPQLCPQTGLTALPAADQLPCPPLTPWRAAAPSPGWRPSPRSAPWPPCSPSPSHPGTV